MCKVIFCTERNFPAGDAGASRILYMAKALLDGGMSVKVFAMGQNKDESWDEKNGHFQYKGVPYINIPAYRLGKIGRIVRRIMAPNSIKKLLMQEKLEAGDKIIVYQPSKRFAETILNYVSKKTDAEVIFDIVEWHQPFQYAKGKWRYREEKYCFEKIYPQQKKLIVISSYLKEYFEKFGCQAYVIPIYVDGTDNVYNRKKIDDRLNLIYPGNPYKKDSFSTMIQALYLLGDDERKRVVLHSTGVTKSFLFKCAEDNVELLGQMLEDGTVVVHEWMEYEELMRLYQEMDFALIARDTNIVTKANYPSKVPELMNKGIPVIISKVGDIVADLIDNENAILFDPDSSEACMLAIQHALKMSDDEIMNMRNKAKLCSRIKFDYRLHVDELKNALISE